MRIVIYRLILVFSLYFSFTSNVSARVISGTVPALDGKSCQVYLHLPDSSSLETFPLAYAQAGSGIYSTSQQDSVPLALQLLVARGTLAVLTLDKPGIQSAPTPKNPESAGIDALIYEKYTTEDLVECGQHALDWALSQCEITTKVGIFFVAHSEGTLAAVRLYQKLLKDAPSLGSRIKALLLSGTPLEPMKDVVSRQLDQYPVSFQRSFWKAYRSKDDTWLLDPSHGGVGYAWFKDAFEAAPLSQTLDELAQTNAAARFEFYQGLNDNNIASSFLLAYEKRSTENLKSKKPALKLDAHYYGADHDLDMAAYADVIGFLQMCLSSNLPFCT
jgi:hypothetical protein